MRGLLLLPLLLILISPGHEQPVPQQDSPAVVLGFKWSRSRQAVENIEHAGTGSAATMLRPEKNLERKAKVNDPPGMRDQRADTTDGRAEALEGIVQESRTPQSKPVDGFAYRAKIRNAGKEAIEIVFWEYQSISRTNPDKVTRRQFLCNVNIKPRKERELQAFSLLGPSDAIGVDALGKKFESEFIEKVFINRVEFADGPIWQRKDWSFAEIRHTYARVVATTWGAEMCRGL